MSDLSQSASGAAPDEGVHFYIPSEGHGLPHDPLNAIVGPRPIGWIASHDDAGKVNLAPYSFFNVFNYTPPIIGFCSVRKKDSLVNVTQTREFTWNLVSRDLAEAMNKTSAPVAYGVDEFDISGLSKVASRTIAVPRVKEAHVSFECKVTQIVQLEDTDARAINAWLVLAEVVGIHIARHLLVDGVYDTAAARPVLRGGGPEDYFEIKPDALFRMTRPTA